MLNRRPLWGVGALLLLAGFALGLVRLFQLRFEAGDIYPPYSSLRADPLGTKALWDSLRRFSGWEIGRHWQPLTRLPDGRGTTLVVAGAQVSDWRTLGEHEFQALERFLHDGGRVVVCFYPSSGEALWRRLGNAQPVVPDRDDDETGRSDARSKGAPASRRAGEDGNRRPAPPRAEKTWPQEKRVSLDERWGIAFLWRDLPQDEAGVVLPAPVRREGDLPLPESLRWHTALCFEATRTNWNAPYLREGFPVVVERRFGRGSLVLSSDSWFLSNEALRRERHADLLAWLVGRSRRVLFDEAHLGIEEAPGVASLMRRYRLHGLVIGLLVVAGLFVWRNATSLVPPTDEVPLEDGQMPVRGRESGEGLVNLLRRSIPSSEILGLCLAEWKKDCERQRPNWTGRTERIAFLVAAEQAKPARERDPVRAYQSIARLLAERGGAGEAPGVTPAA